MQCARELDQVLGSQLTRLNSREFPMGKADSQGEYGKSSSRSDIDPKSWLVQWKSHFRE